MQQASKARAEQKSLVVGLGSFGSSCPLYGAQLMQHIYQIGVHILNEEAFTAKVPSHVKHQFCFYLSVCFSITQMAMQSFQLKFA